MKTLSQFQIYIDAQKAVGIQFILVGAGIVIVSALAHFLGSSELTSGLKVGALAAGLFISISGYAYRETEIKLLHSQTLLFNKDHIAFRLTETKRMEKVLKDYPIYQIVFGSFIVIALIFILSTTYSFWCGIALSIILLSTGVMIVEAYSHHSIKHYYTYLSNLTHHE